MKLRYKYRIYPYPNQQVALAKAFGCARVVWNDALAKSQEMYVAKEKYNINQLMKLCITEAKKSKKRYWLSEVSNVVLQQSLRDLDIAYCNWWSSCSGKRKGRKVEKPKFKKHKNQQTIRFVGKSLKTNDSTVWVSKVGKIPIIWSRPLPSKPSSVTIIKDCSGRYFASFVVEVEPELLPESPNKIGIDLGLESLAVTCNGEKFIPPKFLRKALKRIKKLQSNLSRKKKGSNRREVARKKLAKLHAHVSDSRLDFLHKLSTKLINENQVIVLEDLAVSNMMKNKRLAKSITDAGWRTLRTLLEAKAVMYGRKVIVINRWFASSQICSTCGHNDGKKELSVRNWICSNCGAEHDRDVNAAQNILAAGLAESQNGRRGERKTIIAVAAADETSTHLKDLMNVESKKEVLSY
jgi:putative transposase